MWLNLPSQLEGRSNWRVVKVRIKVTTKVKVWEEIGFQNRRLKILHHDRVHHWQTTTKVAYVFPSAMSKDCSSNIWCKSYGNETMQLKWHFAYFEKVKIYFTNYSPSKRVLFHLPHVDMLFNNVCSTNAQCQNPHWGFWTQVEVLVILNVQHYLQLIVFSNDHGYGVLEHLTSCLGVCALWYSYKLEVACNKYYLKHTMAISHKSTFVMVRRDLIPDTIKKRAKEDSMEAQLWA